MEINLKKKYEENRRHRMVKTTYVAVWRVRYQVTQCLMKHHVTWAGALQLCKLTVDPLIEYINDPCYITYLTLKPVFWMVCQCFAPGEHRIKNALSSKGNQTKKNEIGEKCDACKVSMDMPEGKKYHLEGIGRDGRIILERILNRLGRSGLAWSGSW